MRSLKQRPSSADYKHGWTTFLDLVDLLDLKQCIVYGLEGRKLSALSEAVKGTGWVLVQEAEATKVGKSRPRVSTLSKGSRTVRLFFIRHPSAYFSWRSWGGFLKEQGFLLV